jgi:hypothetical protein
LFHETAMLFSSSYKFPVIGRLDALPSAEVARSLALHLVNCVALEKANASPAGVKDTLDLRSLHGPGMTSGRRHI